MNDKLDNEFSRAMVVVAHADDAEWGCSGTVARWCAEGWDVAYVICTDGSKGSDDPAVTSDDLATIREDEQREAARVLGLSQVFFLGFPDAYLESTLQLRKDISRAIRIHRPDVLVCMNPVRNLDGGGYIDHPDHFASGDAAMGAVYPAGRDRLTFPELAKEGLDRKGERGLGNGAYRTGPRGGCYRPYRNRRSRATGPPQPSGSGISGPLPEGMASSGREAYRCGICRGVQTLSPGLAILPR